MESHITIDAFLKAITEFNDDSVNLNRENVISYCLLKNKYVLIFPTLIFPVK